MDAGLGRQSAAEGNINRLLVGLVSLGFLALLVSAAVVVWFQLRNQEHATWVEHSREVETQLGDFSAQLERVETARRGYLVNGDEAFRRTFEENAAEVPRRLEGIAEATRDNALQQDRIREARELLREQQALQRRTLELVRTGARERALADFAADRSVPATRRLRVVVRELRNEEQRLLVARDAEQRNSLAALYAVLAVAGLLLIVVAGTTLLVMLRYVRNLNSSQAELKRLNENLEEAVEERTVDLRRANDEIQRFAYIVSHDLRSPLVNVMGFTAELDAARKTIVGHFDTVSEAHPELVAREAEVAAREDLPEAIGFIRTSTQKMDRLINAILRLSREGRRTITPESLDMEALVQGIADSLHHRIVEVGAEIRIDAPLPAIVSDRVAIEQIFSNLIENAVKYLQPGRPGLVQVRGRLERDRVIYEVADNGRGIDPRDHERVFDLFRRSGTQDQPGEGIGLAHVRALAYRLGGVIDVTSELDRGATFRLSLPVRYGAIEGN